MRPAENYAPFVIAGLGLTWAIGAVVQMHLLREPARLETVQATEQAHSETAGRALFDEHCAACHGAAGEGKPGVGPALNARELLKTTPDEILFGLTNTGVPSTLMPAWGQAFGGPFTDDQVRQLVAFMRAWEPTAPETRAADYAPDPERGAAIFAGTCFVCHGDEGQGTERGPLLNDPARLDDFEPPWYRNTIAYGRPAKGMPSWGAVLSPQQIDDVVALLMAWRDGQSVRAAIPLSKRLASALFALQQFDPVDAQYYLTAALTQASGPAAAEIQAALDLIAARDRAGAEASVLALLPPEQIGQELYAAYCASCHELDGTGGLGKSLRANAFIVDREDAELVRFLAAGREGTAMDALGGVLTEEQLGYIVLVLRAWQ